MSSVLNTTSILEAFSQEITDNGGSVTDKFQEENLLLARSVLPLTQEARPGDQMHGGVAIRATDQEAWIHPYTFRLVCTNGAIMARTSGTCHITDIHLQNPERIILMIRQSVHECAQPEVFSESMQQIRSAAEASMDMALQMLPLATRFLKKTDSGMIAEIIRRFLHKEDRSPFGLMNAITSTARETSNRRVRWDLEELGGIIASMPKPVSPQFHRAARIESAMQTA